MRILILGATSSIAEPLAALLASEGAELLLAGRDLVKTEEIASRIRHTYGVSVLAEEFEALDYASHRGFLDTCITRTGPIDGVILLYGYIGNQLDAETDFSEAKLIIETNLLSCISILTIAANYLEARRCGFLCAVSSVAGDRGKRSNYVYGSSKAGLSTFLQGLRSRLHRSGVTVTTVKPGYIRSRMTQGMAISPRFLSEPQVVASAIKRAIEAKKPIVYTPWYWRYIMLAMNLVPENMFKRLGM